MIKFFRKIRQRLLTENKFSKYLIYAIGEIVLVVIGIVIALQINNWNNQQRDNQSELKYLNQIKNSLRDNDLILKERIESDKRILKFGERLSNHIKSKKDLNDSIKQIFIILQYDQMVSFNMAAYDNLKNEGLSFITNDDIKFEIINIHDQELKYIQNVFANQFENYLSQVVNPFFSKNFEWSSTEKKIAVEPNDYQNLLKNKELNNIITALNTYRNFAISKYSETQKKIKELEIKLEKEINKLNE